MGDRLFKKGLVVGIIVVFIVMSFGSSTGRIDRAMTRTTIFDGSLLGYVNDTSGNPIEGALVRVYFHGTYEENYSDENSYYHVANIPICYCLKNATCSKDGYITEWVLLSITENTTHDFVLMPNHPPSAPTITGPINGKIGIAYTFQFNAVDPDNDDIKYEIEWGDGKEEVTDFYPSGEIVPVKHVWKKIGTYLIMARAQDEHGSKSDWATPPIPITITKNKDKPINTLVQNLIQQYFKVGSQQSSSLPSSLNVMSVIPTVEKESYIDDTTPPVTTISFDPPEPDGENGWYVSNVTVFLNSSDYISGVNMTKYRIGGGMWQTYIEPFILVDDGNDILIEFYSIDNAGNPEENKSAEIDIDQTLPIIDLTIECNDGNPFEGWDLYFTAQAYDDMSGMNRVEFYVDYEFQGSFIGSGPFYEWVYHYSLSCNELSVRGLICNSEITDEYVKFFAIIIQILGPDWKLPLLRAYAYDNAGNWDFDDILGTSPPGNSLYYLCLFENFKIPNNYTGFIGRYFIWATFSNP